jgi:uncharacterized membrane protein YkoI
MLIALVAVMAGCADTGQATDRNRTDGRQETTPKAEPDVNRMLAADRAAEIARSAVPNASGQELKWQTPVYVPAAEVNRNGTVERRKAWVVTAAAANGQQTVVSIDAATGDVLQTQTKAAPAPTETAGPNTAKITREKLLATVAVNSPNSDASAVALYEFPVKNPERWVAIYVVTLVKKADRRPAGTMVIDAVTGDLLTVSNPPGGN